MERTLFTPAMIETFKACRKAYWIAYEKSAYEKSAYERPVGSNKAVPVKSFLLRGIAEINRGRVANMHQLMKFMGQHWPANEMSNDNAARAFLFAYKTLCNYMSNIYKPNGAQVVGVNLKVRARIGSLRIYVEDTFDLILWHPSERRLELVDFRLKPVKPFDPAWPSASTLVRQYLAEKLRCRWPFEKLSMTYCQIGDSGKPVTFPLEESLFRLHWPELLKVVGEMKDPDNYDAHPGSTCERCYYLATHLTPHLNMNQFQNLQPMSKTA